MYVFEIETFQLLAIINFMLLVVALMLIAMLVARIKSLAGEKKALLATNKAVRHLQGEIARIEKERMKAILKQNEKGDLYRSLLARIEFLEARPQASNDVYRQAMDFIQKGYSLENLVENGDLSRAEVELMRQMSHNKQ